MRDFIDDLSRPYPSYEHALIASKLAKHPERISLCDTVRSMENIREVKKFVNKHLDDNSWWKERSVRDLTCYVSSCVIRGVFFVCRCNNIAEKLLRDKFMRSKDLRQKLQATERRNLVFGNDYHEMVWGIHLPSGKGDNMLGKLLMKIRDEISKGSDLTLWLQHSVLEGLGCDAVPGMHLGSIGVMVSSGEDSNAIIDEECKVVKKKPTTDILFATIGKQSSSDIVVYDNSISRLHAVAIAAPPLVLNKLSKISTYSAPSILAIDLGSEHRTSVDEQAIPAFIPIHLTSSNVVSFGLYARKYRFDYMAPSTASKKQGDIYSRVVSSASSTDNTDRARLDNTVYVGNLSYDMSDSAVKQLFATCGSLVPNGFDYPKDRATGKPRGYALLTFVEASGVTKALFRDGDEVDGRKIRVKRAERVNKTDAGSYSSSTGIGMKREADGPSYGLQKKRY
jgi:hypothetical protein